MKIACKLHGVHFKEDFKIAKKCQNVWYSMGLGALPLRYKRTVWVWLFALPVDKIWLKTKFQIGAQVTGRYNPFGVDNEFAENVPGYKRWGEKRRKEFQKDFSNFVNLLNEPVNGNKILLNLFQKYGAVPRSPLSSPLPLSEPGKRKKAGGGVVKRGVAERVSPEYRPLELFLPKKTKKKKLKASQSPK